MINISHKKAGTLTRHRTLFVGLCLAGVIAPQLIFGDNPQKKSEASLPPPAPDVKVYPIKPTVPSADRRQPGKVFLERADRLWMDDRIDSNYQVLTGNVEFRKGDMFMYCDSAHFYDREGSFEAFGHVRMEQGDTLFVYADMLDYDGLGEIATFYGNGMQKVRLINRDVELTSDVFHYNTQLNLGYYDTDGKIVDSENELTSLYGEYSPDTKEALFRINVVLQDLDGKDFRLVTEELRYNTESHMAQIVSPSVIYTDSATVYSSNGWYNTETSVSELYDRSLVRTKRGNTLTGDTLFYDNVAGVGRAFGNMVLTDSIRQCALRGDYGCYFQETDSSLATIRAELLEYSRGDTLYLHGDTVKTYRVPGDTLHIAAVYHKVRFWRKDLQGLCDSITILESDSIMYMDRHPIVWSGQRQVFGNRIQVHFNDSTADWAKLPDFGFVAEHIQDEFYNQLTGKEMLATFADGNLKQLDVSGNVEIIMLPQENDSTYNKIVNSTSSFMKAEFGEEGKLRRMSMWPEVSGTVTPLYLAKKSIFYLSSFKWYESLRPVSRDDIFVIPEEMKALLAEPDTSARRRRVN